jgi:hypothetical protein
MSNFGIGIGAFMQGMNSGIESYEKIESAMGRKALRNTAKEGADRARTMRQEDIGKSIIRGAEHSEQGPVQTFQVGSQQYGSEADATAAAEKQVGSFLDYYTKTAMPEIQEQLLATGEVEKAQALGKMMEDASFQKGVRLWGNAVQAFQTGNSEGFKDNLLKAYNQTGYFDDGTTALGIEDLKNDKGQLQGYKIRFRDASGKETEQTFDGEDVGRLALNALSPEQVVSNGIDQLKAAQAARAEMAGEERKFQRDVALKQYDQGLGIQRDANSSQLRMAEEADKRANGGDSTKVREANAMANALRQAGWPDDKVKAEMPRLLGIYRQSQSPTDRLASTVTMLAKADLDYAGLPDTEKVARAKALMDAMDAELAQAEGAQQQPAAVPSQGKGVTIWTR